MVTLYGSAGSRSTRALWALEELQVPYEYVSVNLLHGRAGNQNLADLNPAMKVPVLKDDDFLLTESMAICLYLAEQDRERRLLPSASPRQQARHLQWCSFVISELEQPLWTHVKHTFALPKQLRLPAVRATAEYEFATALKVLESGFPQEDDYILGDQFTVADILIGNTLHWASSAGWPIEGRSVTNYLQRLQDRPALLRALQREAGTMT